MFGLNEYVYLLILALASVITLFIISKLLGKKQIAQLEFIDYAIGISIGSIAAEMATDTSDHPIWFYLIAMGIFFLFDIFVSLLGRKSPFLKHFLKGKPLTIIYNGKLEYNNLKKSKLDVNDVIAMCREQGYFDITKIAFAIFENSGKLSVMPNGENAPVVAKNIKTKIELAVLPNYLIIDGKISYSTLNNLKKDTKWLFKNLNIASKKDLKKFLFASFDEKNKTFNFTLKIK